MKKQKNEIGITLIALTITIIVLLILSGVTIAAISGDNGILQNSARAKEETKQVERDEKEKLGDMEDILNEYTTDQTVEQVTDENPGVLEGTGTEKDPYVINSIEDLVVFANNVREGTTYEGQTVKLGLSLDFKSNKSYVEPLRTDYEQYGYDGELKVLLTSGDGFIPIGTMYDTNISTDYFKGTFDGRGNTIYNLYQDIENSEYVTIAGLFSTNEGTIKDIQVENINISGITNNSYLLYGGIVGRNKGTVEQCSTSGKMIIQANGILSNYIGGIVGQSASTKSVISQCSSNIEIKVNSSNTNMLEIGGIGESETIKNCYFTGKILVKCSNSGQKFISGISNRGQSIINCYNVGKIELYTENENAKGAYISGITYSSNVENCYNIGDISCQNNIMYVAGIGTNVQNGKINNCYNVGSLKATGNNITLGSLIGYTANQIISNSKWLTGTADKAIGGEGSNVTKNNIQEVSSIKEMPSVLSVINSENAFKKDTDNINNGYPILNWQ